MTTAGEILGNPLALAALAAVLALAAWHVSNSVGPRAALRLERLRTPLFRLLDPVFRRRGRPLTRDKTGETGERIAAVACEPTELARALFDHGFEYNPTSTKKHIEGAGGSERWSLLSVARRENGRQTHLYAFATAGPNTIEVWGHEEASVTDPDAHLEQPQTDGPRTPGIEDALEQAGEAVEWFAEP